LKWQQIKDKIIYVVQRLFSERNGVDHLTIFLFTVSFLLSVLAQVANLHWLMLFYYAGMVLCFYRVLSRNVWRRREENQTFLYWIEAVASLFQTQRRTSQEKRTYKYVKCPNCRQRLRVPKGKGEISITCSKCGNQIIKKV